MSNPNDEMRRAAEEAIAQERHIAQLERCRKFQWASYTGAGYFCPFPDGVCMIRSIAREGEIDGPGTGDYEGI